MMAEAEEGDRWMAFSKPIEERFALAIADRPKDWKYRAVAGLATRETYGDFAPQQLEAANRHGLSRAVTNEEREAWTFGFTWVDRELFRARATLCDLLLGRVFRGHAERELGVAFECERYGAPPATVTEGLDRAAHLEWIAQKSEWGQILWGCRLNRDGQKPEGG